MDLIFFLNCFLLIFDMLSSHMGFRTHDSRAHDTYMDHGGGALMGFIPLHPGRPELTISARVYIFIYIYIFIIYTMVSGGLMKGLQRPPRPTVNEH